MVRFAIKISMKRTYQPSKIVIKEDMDLDLECQHQVVKKYSSEEGKKEEKSYLPKKIHSLKKRVDIF